MSSLLYILNIILDVTVFKQLNSYIPKNVPEEGYVALSHIR